MRFLFSWMADPRLFVTRHVNLLRLILLHLMWKWKRFRCLGLEFFGVFLFYKNTRFFCLIKTLATFNGEREIFANVWTIYWVGLQSFYVLHKQPENYVIENDAVVNRDVCAKKVRACALTIHRSLQFFSMLAPWQLYTLLSFNTIFNVS